MNLILLSATQEAQLALGAGSCHEQFAGNLSFGPGGEDRAFLLLQRPGLLCEHQLVLALTCHLLQLTSQLSLILNRPGWNILSQLFKIDIFFLSTWMLIF